MTGSKLRLIALAGITSVPILVASPTVDAGSSSAGEEFLSNAEAAPPNILFLLDLSDDMDDGCGEARDSGDSGDGSYDSCLEYATDAIGQIAQHFDWAYYGVIGTTGSASDDNFEAIAPLGSAHGEVQTALNSVTTSGSDVRNLAEAWSSAFDYFEMTSSSSCPSYMNTSLVSGATFCDEAPITWACQDNHVITITSDRAREDDGPVNYTSSSSMTKDIKCDWNTGITTTDADCFYDNALSYGYNADARSDLTGDQNVIGHTVAIKVGGSSIAETVFGNASDEIGNEGIYTVSNEGDEILGDIMTVMSYIRSGYYSRSAPVVSADGDYVIFSFYEITGDNPLGEGHVRAYEVETDPTSGDYGSVLYDGSSQFGGAVWDAGDLLVSRPVITAESNPGDQDGLGQRDIYTFVPEFMDYSGNSMYSEGTSDLRMGFDREFYDAVDTVVSNNDSAFLDTFLDTTDADSDGCADDLGYDLDQDGCDVDLDDLQYMIDFVRGLPTAKYRYLDQSHGYWKLGDSPHSVPAVISARDDNFTVDPTYRNYLQSLVADDVPDVVYIAANDGMLHAFRLEDDPSTTTVSGGPTSSEDAQEEGEELWAWIPANTLYDSKDEEWSGNLIDMMWYGRTFLFDGSPVIEDVWIDGYGGTADGSKESDGSEWRRVLVVQQGKGGPVTIALDVTDPNDPQFLWEVTNDDDESAMGYTVSTPVIGNLYNAESSSAGDYHDTWTAMWGGGRGVPYGTSSTNYYNLAEGNIYFHHVGDDYWGTHSTQYSDEGSNYQIDSGQTATGLDSDSDYEYSYISGALAAVDADNDGDIDVLYYPVTTSYEPSDAGDPDGDGGSGVTDISDPGHTWMYKAIIDTADPDDPTWCEFYDPLDTIGTRPEVYYSATTSWHVDGSLGVYWGTGTPYDRDSTDPGYFFAVKDESPLTCSGYTAISDCGTGGAYKLNAGEGLTGNPIVYAGTVYFSTYEPDSDRCTEGTGRIYGLAFDDCDGNVDTDGDGVGDDTAVEVDGYPSSITVGKHGVYYGTSDRDSSTVTTVGELSSVADPFMDTNTMGFREVF
jgi:hypothetical protein